MTASTTSNVSESQATFIQCLKNLDAGERARLKRNAGRTVSEARNVTGLFYSILPYTIRETQQDTFFLVATLYPLAGESSDRNLGATLNRVRSGGNAAALDRRVNALLDADAGQLPFRLRQIIRLIDSSRQGVNWERLLSDLLKWNWQDRPVQKQWAMSYYGLPDRPDRTDEEGAALARE